MLSPMRATPPPTDVPRRGPWAIRMRPGEYALIRAAAASAGEYLATWARQQLLAAARRQLAELAERGGAEAKG